MARKRLISGVDSSTLVSNLNSEIFDGFLSKDILDYDYNASNTINEAGILVKTDIEYDRNYFLIQIKGYSSNSELPIDILCSGFFYSGVNLWQQVSGVNLGSNIIKKITLFFEDSKLNIWIPSTKTTDTAFSIKVLNLRIIDHKNKVILCEKRKDTPEFGSISKTIILKNTGSDFEIIDLPDTVSTLDTTSLPSISNVSTIILRYNGVVQDLDTYLSNAETSINPLPLNDGVEVSAETPSTLELQSGIIPMTNLDTYVGKPNNWLKIYVPNNYLDDYIKTYPTLYNYFYSINANNDSNRHNHTGIYNLFDNSRTFLNWKFLNKTGFVFEKEKDFTVITNKDTNTMYEFYYSYQLKPNTVYTFSAYIKGDPIQIIIGYSQNSKTTLLSDIYNSQVRSQVYITVGNNKSEDFEKYWVTFLTGEDTAITNNNFIFRFNTNKKTYMYAPKLEEGCTPTEWTPSINDYFTEMEYLNKLTDKIEFLSYGVEWDENVSASKLDRIGNMSMHRSLPIQSKIRGCILNDDGEVIKYLPDTDWSDEDTNGELGQVMVEIPEHYIRFRTEGTKHEVRISEDNLNGFTKVPKMYISAYEAALDRNEADNFKLSSVKSQDTRYRGGNNNVEWDDTYKSLLGRPVTYTNQINLMSYARNRNTEDEDCQWNIYTYLAHRTLIWLYCIEYANRDIQSAYNTQLTDEGYKQGGLGNGFTTLNAATVNLYNDRYPYVPCGYTNELGNNSGYKDYTVEGIGVKVSEKNDMTNWNITQVSYRNDKDEVITENLSKIEDGSIVVMKTTNNNQTVASVIFYNTPLKNRYKIEGLTGTGLTLSFLDNRTYESITEDGEVDIEWDDNIIVSRLIKIDKAKSDLNIKISLVSSEACTVHIPSQTAQVMRYRGIENLYGHIYKILSGIYIKVVPEDKEQNTPYVSDVYTCLNPKDFNSDIETFYTNEGQSAILTKFIRKIIFGENGCFVPSDVEDGGTSTYFADCLYYSKITKEETRCTYVSGGYSSNKDCGLFHLSNDHLPTTSNVHVGTRLVYHPKES